MEHNASIIGEYTGILLLNECRWKGILILNDLAHSKMAYCKIMSKHPYAPIQWQTELLELAVIIKCTMYSYIKNNKICSWTVA